MAASRRCGATWRRSAGRRSSGGYFRQPWTSAESELRSWFAEECAARGLAVETDGIGNQVAWWEPSGGARPGPGRPHRLAPRLGPRRRGVRRPAGRGVRARRGRHVAGPGLRAGAPDRHRRLRRGGGLAVRTRLPRLAAGHRRHDVGAGEGAARPRRRLPRRRDQRRRTGPCAGPAGPRPRRHLRRAPRRAGPRPRRPRRGRRAGQRDLAARAVALRLRRPGQPRRHAPAWRTGTTRC